MQLAPSMGHVTRQERHLKIKSPGSQNASLGNPDVYAKRSVAFRTP